MISLYRGFKISIFPLITEKVERIHYARVKCGNLSIYNERFYNFLIVERQKRTNASNKSVGSFL